MGEEFDDCPFDDDGEDMFDPADECGRTQDGTCMLAGTEWCDFECPYRDGGF
jgi:hypothetical protein